MNWQPIATAPYDVKIMLAKFVPDEGCYWVASGDVTDGELWIDFTDSRHEWKGFQDPSHWAPFDHTPPEDMKP